MRTTLSPIPEKSPVTDKNIISMDWLRFFRELHQYIQNVLNRYDSSRSGVATLVAGTVTVSTDKVSSTCKIVLHPQEGVLNIGTVYPSAKVVGTSFTIQSSNNLDTRNVFYKLVEAF